NREFLNPESLNPESLNRESLNPESLNRGSLNPESLNRGSLNRYVRGTKCANSSGTMANKLEELPIYSKVVAFWIAVNATLENPKLRCDCDLHEQISRANDSMPSNMVEGFE